MCINRYFCKNIGAPHLAPNKHLNFTDILLFNYFIQVQPYPSSLDESMIASFTGQQDLPTQTDLSRVEYFAVPANTTQMPVHALYPYEYLAAAGISNKEQSGAIYQAGFQAGINLMQQQLGECYIYNNFIIAVIKVSTRDSSSIPTGVIYNIIVNVNN